MKQNNMKEEIEDFINKSPELSIAFERYQQGFTPEKQDEMFEEILNQLTTLLDKVREEAVSDFVDNIKWLKIEDIEDNAMGYDDVIAGKILVSQMNEYLQSIKEEK